MPRDDLSKVAREVPRLPHVHLEATASLQLQRITVLPCARSCSIFEEDSLGSPEHHKTSPRKLTSLSALPCLSSFSAIRSPARFHIPPPSGTDCTRSYQRATTVLSFLDGLA